MGKEQKKRRLHLAKRGRPRRMSDFSLNSAHANVIFVYNKLFRALQRLPMFKGVKVTDDMFFDILRYVRDNQEEIIKSDMPWQYPNKLRGFCRNGRLRVINMKPFLIDQKPKENQEDTKNNRVSAISKLKNKRV